MTRLLRLLAPALTGVALLLTGCGNSDQTESGLPAVSFQTDWYAQAEHGGYYQAVTSGYFVDEGIEVDVLVGGPGALGTQKVATGRADLAMGRSDDVMLAVQEGLPIVIVCALMQHDPQAILLHEENPVDSFEDLDGKSVMTVPGTSWVLNVEATYGIEMNVIPMNYGLAQFMADKDFIQQCFITNEPYYVRKNGANPKTLLIASSGYDPYRVIFTSRRYAAQYPDRVRAFVAASIKGWDTFLHGDNASAKAMIAARNENMSDEFLDYSTQAMREHQLVTGDPARGERIGLLKRSRMEQLAQNLLALGILEKPMPLEDYATFEFLPPELRALAED